MPATLRHVVVTGIGAVGAVTLGILASGDPAGPARLAAIALVVAGVVLLRAAEG